MNPEANTAELELVEMTSPNFFKCTNSECKAEAMEGELFCEEHAAVAEEANTDPKEDEDAEDAEDGEEKEDKSSEMVVKGLMSLHLTAYMLVESLTDEFPSLCQQFKEDVEEVKNGYEMLLDEYGLEKVSEYVGPLSCLMAVTGKHFMVASIKKKQSTLTQ